MTVVRVFFGAHDGSFVLFRMVQQFIYPGLVPLLAAYQAVVGDPVTEAFAVNGFSAQAVSHIQIRDIVFTEKLIDNALVVL